MSKRPKGARSEAKPSRVGRRKASEERERDANGGTEPERMTSAEKTRLAADAALDVKAEELIALDVRELTSIADVFLIATGRSDRQVRAIADSIEKAAKRAGEPPLGIEGYAEGRWVLIDLDDVIAHVFQPDARQHYDLERLWRDAPRIELEARRASKGELPRSAEGRTP